MKNLFKNSIVLILSFYSNIGFSYADSPLTIIDFSSPYQSEPSVILASKSNGILSSDLIIHLTDAKLAVDIKMAIINELSWSVEGKQNASLFFDYLKLKRGYIEITDFIEDATGDDLLCYAYLEALDDYSDMSDALYHANLALLLNPTSRTFNIIQSLIHVQNIYYTAENWCTIFTIPSTILTNESLKKDMNINAENLISNSLYDHFSEYCNTVDTFQGDDSDEPIVEYNEEIENYLDFEFNFAYETLTNSPYFLYRVTGLDEMIKNNGGIGLGLSLEACPDNRPDHCSEYSETYDFLLSEDYEFQKIVVERFSYNPITNELFVYDLSEDMYMRIEKE